MIQLFELKDKKNLTHNIYELTFEAEKEIIFKNWQFITFLINVWWRAYSILKNDWKNITLIIKKWLESEWWRWWSKFLCELNIWEKIKWVGPAGHFVLQNNNKNKLFIWTWTGFVPLYNQIIGGIQDNPDTKFKIIFGSRKSSDLFYLDELTELKQKYNNFDYEIYTSSEKNIEYNHWYVTDFLKNEEIKNFEEFYICWIPVMIDSAKQSLIDLWFEENNIHTEKY